MSLIGMPHFPHFARDPLTRDFGRLLNSQLDSILNFGGYNDLAPQIFGGQFNARMDLSETEKGYTVCADVPGVNKEDIDIHVKDNLLTISGERSSDKEIKDDQRHIVERSYGKFSRSLRLPNDADADKVTASMENGVLELLFGKKPSGAVVKKISLK
ncbi:Heat shock protein HSP 90-beta [Entophlyctis luteolus]|nr:Heat shock protein HSP 90-beta [Entophlyctis luteolus]